MAKKSKRIIEYLKIPLPFIIYMGLTIVLSFLLVLIFIYIDIASYVSALIFSRIMGTSPNAGEFSFDFLLSEQAIGDLTSILLFLTPVLTGIFFFFWYRRLSRKSAKQDSGIRLFRVKNILLILMAGLGLQLAIAGLMELILPHFGDLSESYNELMEQIETGNPILMFISVVIIAPVSEELTFRGVIMKKTRAVTSFLVANILQAMFFGIAHLNIVQGIYAFLGGLVMGYIAYKYKTIKASLLLHIFFNGLNYVLISPSSPLLQLLYVGIGVILVAVSLILIGKVCAETQPDEQGLTGEA